MIDDIIKEYTSNVAKEIDSRMYDFLEENGYVLERGNVKQILELKEKLAKEDKQVRVESGVVGNELCDEGLKIITNYIFFFDSISNPIGRKDVEMMIVNDWIRRNKE